MHGNIRTAEIPDKSKFDTVLVYPQQRLPYYVHVLELPLSHSHKSFSYERQ